LNIIKECTFLLLMIFVAGYQLYGSHARAPELVLIVSTIRAGEDAHKVTVNQVEVIQLCIIKTGDFLTGVDKIDGAVFDANGNEIMDLEFVDDGDREKGDGKRMDGIYSTIVIFPSEGSYTIKAALEVKDYPLRVTRLSMTRPREEVPRSWLLGDPINMTFSLTASLDVVADSTVEVLPIPTGMPDYGFWDEEEPEGDANAIP